MSNITSFEKPRCSLCKAFKSDDELNGYDPTVQIGKRYKSAYCRELAQCDSDKAREILDRLIDDLASEPETK